jgi:hypothetical protein
MTVATVTVADPANPVELQAWLDANPAASIFTILGSSATFYILYS